MIRTLVTAAKNPGAAIRELKRIRQLSASTSWENGFRYFYTTHLGSGQWFRGEIGGEGGLIELDILGNTMWVDPNDHGISRQLYLGGIHERAATGVFRAELSEINDSVEEVTVLEIGGNIGYYSVIEASIIGPDGRILCLEPEPHNIEMLRRNMRANGYQDLISITQGAMSDENGSAELQLSTNSNLHTLERASQVATTGATLTVPTYTVPTFLDEQGVAPGEVNVVRVDVEGHEGSIFEAIDPVLEGDRPLLLFVEFHDVLVDSGRMGQMLQKLEENGLDFLYGCNDHFIDGPTEELEEIGELRDNLKRHGNAEIFLKKGY